MFLAKFNGAGTHRWGRHAGDALEQMGRAVTNDSSNNVIAVGRFQGTMSFGAATLTSAGGNDGYIVQYGP